MNLVRGMDVVRAQNELLSLKKAASPLVLHLVKSAIASAKAKDYREEELFISESLAQEGRRAKRHFVRARGRSTQYVKRMSHLKISLAKIEKPTVEDNKASKVEKIKKITKKVAEDK